MTHNEHPNQDPRVKRTHKLILEAMVELTARKGFSTVTVRDITEYAGINRATFYRHYQDKYDLLNQYAQAVYDLPDVTPDGTARRSEIGADQPTVPGLVNVFDHIRANAQFFRVMLGKNGDPAFSEKIRLFIQKRIRGSLSEELPGNETRLELYLNYVSSASLGALIWWLEQNMPYSPPDLDMIFHRLNASVFNAMFEQTPSPRQSK